MTWEELEADIRKKAAEQPRGFASELARKLGVERAVVSQILSGLRPIPRESVHTYLDALGLEIVIQPKPEASR